MHICLRLQAHYNARAHSDEFVVDLLVSLDKVKALIHDLLVIEVRGSGGFVMKGPSHCYGCSVMG